MRNNSRKLKALVVEDSLVGQRLLDIHLTRIGFDISFIDDGISAIKEARTLKYDIMFLDVVIPKLDGFKVCKILKKDKLIKGMPIIMLTSKDGAFDKMKGVMAGSNAYLTKPLVFTKLINVINKYFPIQNSKLIEQGVDQTDYKNKQEKNIIKINSNQEKQVQRDVNTPVKKNLKVVSKVTAQSNVNLKETIKQEAYKQSKMRSQKEELRLKKLNARKRVLKELLIKSQMLSERHKKRD
jgi:twitching motility two-component system response regulator PilG